MNDGRWGELATATLISCDSMMLWESGYHGNLTLSLFMSGNASFLFCFAFLFWIELGAGPCKYLAH